MVAPEAPCSLSMADHSELLQSFYQIPAIDKAWLFPSQIGKDLEAMVVSSDVNLLTNSKRKYQSFARIPKPFTEETTCEWSPFPVQLNGVSLMVPSRSRDKLLIIRNGDSGDKDRPSSTKLEIWSSAQLLKEVIVPASVHGPVYADGWFEGVSWSPDGSYVAYVAESPICSRPVYGTTVKCFGMKSNESDMSTWKGQGDWEDDWGEAYTGKQRPALFVADMHDGSVQKVPGIPDDLSVGQVTWAPSRGLEEPLSLVFVGWQSASENFSTNRKLGIKYCFNRPCALYAIEAFEKKGSSNLSSLQKLTTSLGSAFLPRFSPRGDSLTFLSADEAVKTGVHNCTNSLHSMRWPINNKDSDFSVKEVVAVKQRDRAFPGLYCESLIASPWLLDNETIVLSSCWFSNEVILTINTRSGKVSRISPPHDNSSWNVLSVCNDYILAVKSNFAEPHNLQLGVPSPLSDSSLTWVWYDISNKHLQFPTKVGAVLSSITYEIIQVPISHNLDLDEGTGHYEAIFISSKEIATEKSEQKRPLVVIVHGGPHSVYTTSFSKAIGYLVGIGLNLLVVNYRGSLGFGEEALQSLPGKAGKQDVEDVLRALDYVIAKGLADPKNVAVTGGSHGGFLSTHLIGQAPDRFVTAAVRNPVCNISSMVGATDIPEWCYVETYGQACFSTYKDAPSPDDLEKFYRASPISHIKNVKIPTLFLLGAQDRRVPISNGFQYVHALRSRGLKVKVIVFSDDAHPIDRPQSEFEGWISIGTWLKEHLL